MTLQSLYTALSATNYPTVYRKFPEGEAVTLPCICYYELSPDNFKADGKVYHTNNNIRVELYTQTKNTTAETSVESVFDNNGIVWSKGEEYLDDERCYLIGYDIFI